jgi:2',3'-cyclic-nucleotide 2'-phosphodiesterase (5'-nucleotidase family)
MKVKSFIVIITTILVFSCKEKTLKVVKITATEININSSIAEDENIKDFINPYQKHVNALLDTVLAYSPKTLSKYNGKLNTAIGNLLADAVYEQTNPVFNKRTGKNIDFVLLNHGGIRSSIPKGNITLRTAYEVMPFENYVVVLELSSEKIEELVHYLTSRKIAHPVSSQIKITLTANGELNKALIHQKPIEKNKTYYIATSNYLMNGGDGTDFFLNPISVTETDYLVRNTLIDYFKKRDTITATADNRFIKHY